MERVVIVASQQHVVPTRRERRQAERAARQGGPRRKRAGSRWTLGSLSLLGLVGGIAVVGLAVLLGARPPTTPAGAEVRVARVPTNLVADGFVLGRADAPVTIDLYEDFQCPACGVWGRTVFPSLADNELAAGTVRLVFHDVAFLGQESLEAGRAAWAAAQQDRFWDMWATLYANQGRENSGAFGTDRLIAMAGELGLDVARFEADMGSGAARAAVDDSRTQGSLAGVTSTPTLVIGGQLLVGVQSYEALAAAIETAAP